MKIKVLASVSMFNIHSGGVDSFKVGKEYDVDYETHERFTSRGWAESLEPVALDEGSDTVELMNKPKQKIKHTKKQGVAVENMGV